MADIDDGDESDLIEALEDLSEFDDSPYNASHQVHSIADLLLIQQETDFLGEISTDHYLKDAYLAATMLLYNVGDIDAFVSEQAENIRSTLLVAYQQMRSQPSQMIIAMAQTISDPQQRSTWLSQIISDLQSSNQ